MNGYDEAMQFQVGVLNNPANFNDRFLLAANGRGSRLLIQSSQASVTPMVSMTFAGNPTDTYNDVTNITYHTNSRSTHYTSTTGYPIVVGNRPNEYIDNQGNLTVFSYDSQGRVSSQTTNNVTNTYTYGSNNELLSVSDVQGNIELREFAGGCVAKITRKGVDTTYTRDSDGNILTQTGPNGTTTWTYVNGLVASVQVPTATTPTTITRNADASVQSVTDPSGDTTSVTYTSAGLVESITYADGTKEETAYFSGTGIPQFSRDRLGNITEYEKTNGRLTKVKRGEKSGTLLVSGGVTTNSDQSQISITETVYDVDGLVKETRTNGAKTESFYDFLGRQIKVRRYINAGNYLESETIYGADDRVLCQKDRGIFVGNRLDRVEPRENKRRAKGKLLTKPRAGRT